MRVLLVPGDCVGAVGLPVSAGLSALTSPPVPVLAAPPNVSTIAETEASSRTVRAAAVTTLLFRVGFGYVPVRSPPADPAGVASVAVTRSHPESAAFLILSSRVDRLNQPLPAPIARGS